jgi:hypothetical protein
MMFITPTPPTIRVITPAVTRKMRKAKKSRCTMRRISWTLKKLSAVSRAGGKW